MFFYVNFEITLLPDVFIRIENPTADSKKAFIPLQQGVVLSKKDSPSTREQREYKSKIPYVSAIGSIMYAMLCTNLHIAHALSMTNSKKRFIPLQQRVVLSKKDNPSTKEQREYMSKIPYASAIGSIMYAMLCTSCRVFFMPKHV